VKTHLYDSLDSCITAVKGQDSQNQSKPQGRGVLFEGKGPNRQGRRGKVYEKIQVLGEIKKIGIVIDTQIRDGFNNEGSMIGIEPFYWDQSFLGEEL